MPGNAIYVGRPTKWGNPYMISPIVRGYPSLSYEQCASFVVNQFKFDGRERLGYPSEDEIRRELAGKDLACWCPLVDENGDPFPCHASVLLEIANGGSS